MDYIFVMLHVAIYLLPTGIPPCFTSQGLKLKYVSVVPTLLLLRSQQTILAFHWTFPVLICSERCSIASFYIFRLC